MTETQLLSGDDFETLFTSFQSSAFRLEARESYYEQDELKAFLEFGPRAIPDDFLHEWYHLMRSHADAGREVRRVRVVSEPHSDYTRFGLWLSERNVTAGEDIRYLPRPQAEALRLPTIDYWLLDSTRMYILRFTDDDNLLGGELVTDPDVLRQALEWRDIAWEHAIPRAEYALSHPPVDR
ncbi:DUF6879 family protein [Sphaerisporangium sp. NPDC088356]|uniref:DUF6879 family protein n=1 Tax=Sphaerisporangium sp. NPDC088356 TaxID=3154871 RepID=UPI00342AD366